MIINKHGTFYIRNGWPTKILITVREDPHIFSPNDELQAVDEIGLGRVMIKSLRYWAKAMGLTVEAKDQHGLLCEETELFVELYDHDRYLQDRGSLWLLHRELVINQVEATAWYWTFNEYDRRTFTKEDFVNSFHAYVTKNGGSYGRAAIEKEFDCVKNTYVSDGKFDVEKIIEENTIPFFAPLSRIKSLKKDEHNKLKIYEKQRTQLKDIPLDILYYCILQDNRAHLENNRQIGIDEMMERPCQVSKYFSITYSSFIEMLQALENQGKLKLFNNFGNRHIEVPNVNPVELLQEYYLSIGR